MQKEKSLYIITQNNMIILLDTYDIKFTQKLVCLKVVVYVQLIILHG